MNKHVLSVEQMQHLQELGVADKSTILFYARIKSQKDDTWDLTTLNETDNIFDLIPAYTLQDILDMLPKIICVDDVKYCLVFNVHDSIWPISDDIIWCVSYDDADGDSLRFFYNEPLIDLAYKMLCWVIETGYADSEG